MNVETFLRRMFRVGAHRVIRLPGGKLLDLGDGGAPTGRGHLERRRRPWRRIIAKPSLGVGEAYMDGRLVFERGDDPRPPGARRPQPRGRTAVTSARRPAPRLGHLTDEQNDAPHGAGATSTTTTICRCELYRAFLDSRPAVLLRLFRARRHEPGRGAGGQEAAHRRQARARATARSVLDIGCGWGGHGPDPGGRRRRQRRRRSPSRRSRSPPPVSAPRRRASRDRVRFSLTDYRDVDRALRPHRLGRHVRACRPAQLPGLLRQGRRRTSLTTAQR